MNTHHVSLSAAIGQEAQTPEHKRFRTLMDKLEKARQRLQQWQEQLPLFEQSWQQRVAPELARLREQRHAWALELEQLVLARRWSKSENKALTRELLDLCQTLLAEDDEPDAALKALYNRHADVDYDAEAELELQGMKQMMERIGGVDLGDTPAQSFEDIVEKMREQLAQQASEQRAEHEAAGHGRKPPRRKQGAAARRAEEEARQTSQTVREVYRKLAAALHPDRVAADASEEERALSTERMQRANAAYEAGDLLALLTLQLQIEQVDQAQAARVAATQVRHFNKVLAEQLKELEAEIEGRQEAFEISYGLVFDSRLNPANLGKVLTQAMQDVQASSARLASLRRLLTGDQATAKHFIKRLQAEQRRSDQMLGFW